jgi:hypothetical protein
MMPKNDTPREWGRLHFYRGENQWINHLAEDQTKAKQV